MPTMIVMPDQQHTSAVKTAGHADGLAARLKSCPDVSSDFILRHYPIGTKVKSGKILRQYRSLWPARFSRKNLGRNFSGGGEW